MPTSRTRRTRNRSNAVRKRERARKARAERSTNAGRSFTEERAREFTDADWAKIRESDAAAAEGNLDKALELYDAVPAVVGTELSRGMKQLCELGDDAPPWAWSRWVREQAFRWASAANERRQELALDLALDVAYIADADPERPFGFHPADLVSLVRARDWIVRQVVLYELGGLADFVATAASDQLLQRADPMTEWVCTPMAAYQQVDETPDRTTLLDLETERCVEVLNIGSLGKVEPGGFVLGRVVPISAEPGLMFESRPVEVDELTARRFAERWVAFEHQLRAGDCGCEPDECDGIECEPLEAEPPDWWDEMRDACDDGRLPSLFSLHLEYPLLTDIPTSVWRSASEGAPDLDQLQGLFGPDTPPTVVDAVQVCLHGLSGALVHGRRLTAAGPLYGAVLLEPGVMDVLVERFTLPQYAAGWRALGDLVIEPARSRCQRLAEACDQFGWEDEPRIGVCE